MIIHIVTNNGTPILATTNEVRAKKAQKQAVKEQEFAGVLVPKVYLSTLTLDQSK